jgi:hypothetical protein
MNESELLEQVDNMSDEDLNKILGQLHLLENFPDYSQTALKVQTPKGTIVPFELNGPQMTLHKMIEEHIAPKRLVRLVVLKARRMGFSTYFSGRFYQRTSNQPNRYAIQITHEPDATDFLFKMVKRYYNLSPKGSKPETLYNNTKLLEFNNKEGTGLNSAFRVATAGKDDVGSGQLLHYLHLSETAKWQQNNIKSLLTSIIQPVPDIEDSAIVFESTAKGIGGEFYDRFWGARFRLWISRLNDDGSPVIEESINPDVGEDNIFTSIFFPWFCYEEYQMPVPQMAGERLKGFALDEEEINIQATFNLSLRQMAWRRWTIANKCDGNIDIFNQEYPDTPRAAFLGTGRPVFNNHKLVKLLDAAIPAGLRYEHFANNWVTNPVGRLNVWEEPTSGTPYIISADVAEGLRHGDFSCADVIDHRTGEQVAQWHGSIDSDNVLEFADILAALGRRYNVALIAVERNNHGLGVVTQLYQNGYPNLYAEMVPDPPGRPRKRYGWVTSRATRPLIIDNLIRENQEDALGVNCRETIDEMMAFKIQDNGKMEADHGRHDDRVISLAIGKYVRQVSDLPAMKKQSREKNSGRKRRDRKVNKKAWT